jgi:VWFA-related protein
VSLRLSPAGFALAFVLLAVPPSGAQAPSPPRALPATLQSPSPGNVFPSGAEVVRLDIVVRSKDGKPVIDLRPDELRVSEDGKRCDVSSFQLVQAEPAVQAGALSGRASNAPATKVATAPPPASAVGEPLTSVVALVFDQLGAEAAKNARAAALQFAQKRFPKGSLFAVYKVGQGLRILQAFTEDRAALPAAIEKATTGVDQARDPAHSPDFDNATEEALSLSIRAAQLAMSKAEGTAADARMLGLEARMLRQSDLLAREAKGMGSLRPLLAISQALRSVQGRKSLLYFSEGLLVPPNVEDVFQTTVSVANRANLSVYAFDARGLRVRSSFTEAKLALELAKLGAMAEQTGSGQPAGGGGSELRLNAQGALQDLAESTGGFLVAETNDLRPGLDRVVSDLRSYYEVGYVPPSTKADGRWHDISVKVSRPGVVVRTRRGYFASPAGSLVIQPYEMPLAEALAAKPLPRELEHRAATLRFASGGEAVETLVWVEVPLAGVDFTQADPVYRARVSVLGQVRDEQGELVARLSHDGPIEGPIAEIEAARQGTTVVKKTLRLRPGRYTLETAVQDRESGRVGARRTAFEIPAPTAGLSLGSVALVRADEVDAGTPAGEDPLRVGSLRAMPLLGRSIPEGTPVVSLLLSLQAGPGSGAPAVELEFRRDGQVVGKSKPELSKPDAGGRITYIGSLPTAQLAAGRYELWVRARSGESEASEATGFTITPRPPEAKAPASTDAVAAFVAPAAPPVPPTALEDRKDATTPLAVILERAGRYVTEYEHTFRNLVAQESYRQWGPNPKGGEGSVSRTLRSDLVFVRLPDALSWSTFRDVYDVDGQPVRDRQKRLEKLFFKPSPSAWQQAEAILAEGSRYNIAGAYRTVNAPTLGLLFLRPDNQSRLSFKRKGSRRIAGFEAAEVAFEERARPTLVRGHGKEDVPASGRFWIDATRGTVLRTEIEYDLETQKVLRDPSDWERGTVSTEYRQEPALGAFVPDTMTELYDLRRVGRLEGQARYTGYRRFEVSITTEAAP